MTLHLVYRSYGGENMKDRPPYYSKLLSLASFLQAAQRADAEITFMNDGPIPEDRLRLMQGRGEVIDIPSGPIGMRKSYLMGLRHPGERGWADEDLVYFSEDDYLHTPDAFVQLQAAADASPAPYLTLYAYTPRHPTHPPTDPDLWRPAGSFTAAGQEWVNVASTASSFGARVGALAMDLSIFRQCMLPYRNSYLDHETCVIYQGSTPYNLEELVLGIEDRRRSGAAAMVKNAVEIPFRIAINARGLSRRHRPHLLYAADPNLACHLEISLMAPGRDWTSVARQAAEWAHDQGTPVDLKGV